jgi:hypothetical protein
MNAILGRFAAHLIAAVAFAATAAHAQEPAARTDGRGPEEERRRKP